MKTNASGLRWSNCLAVDWRVRGGLDERKRSDKIIFSDFWRAESTLLTAKKRRKKEGRG